MNQAAVKGMRVVAASLFTKGHEPHGFLVQSQGNGCYMVLQKTDEGWKRVQENVSTYVGACEVADVLATR